MLILPRKSRVLPPATFIRTSTAYDSLGRLIAAGRARIERIAGQWGVLVEEGTANLFDGQLESGNIDTSGVPYASASVIRTKNFQAVNASTQYSLSNSAGYPIARLCAYDTSYVFISTIGGTTFTTPANCRYLKWALVGTVITTRAQLEAKPYSTSFHDTTRAAETLTIPTAGILSPTQGYIRMWVYVNALAKRRVAGQYPTILLLPRAGGGTGLWAYHSATSAQWLLQTRNDADGSTTAPAVADSLTSDGGHWFTIAWSETEAKMLIDGVKGATLAAPNLPSGFGTGYLGAAAAQHFINTYFGPVQCGSNYLGDAEDLAAVNAGGILPDANTTLIWRPQGSRRLIL
jgi:hypothetical protein